MKYETQGIGGKHKRENRNGYKCDKFGSEIGVEVTYKHYNPCKRRNVGIEGMIVPIKMGTITTDPPQEVVLGGSEWVICSIVLRFV